MEIAINQKEIENRIFTIRDIQVMIDRDLAEVYSVDTKVLNQAVKRNIERFPDIFRFQLTENEKNELVTNCDRFRSLKHSSSMPYAFTEQGVAMLSAVLRSETAIQVSIQIMNAFVEIKTIADTHDRFLLLDHKELYHIGASLKDLGKKWFAFSRMDDFAPEILNQLQKNHEQ